MQKKTLPQVLSEAEQSTKDLEMFRVQEAPVGRQLLFARYFVNHFTERFQMSHIYKC